LEIAFLVVFWAGFIWLFWSKKGIKIMRALFFIAAPVILLASLYIHWQLQTALICGLAGFLTGGAFVEWFYDIRSLNAQREDLQRQRQLLEREAHFQQAQSPWLDSESGELTYRSGPAVRPPAKQTQ
jgi:hypothetical protein